MRVRRGVEQLVLRVPGGAVVEVGLGLHVHRGLDVARGRLVRAQPPGDLSRIHALLQAQQHHLPLQGGKSRQRLVQQGQVALVQRLEAAYENGGVVHGFKCSLNNSVQRLFIGR